MTFTGNSIRYDIEALRVIAMLCIVSGHCFAVYGVWSTGLQVDNISEVNLYRAVNPLLIYFALPVFTAISGYLIGYRGTFSTPSFSYSSFFLRKVKRLYVPALFFSLLYALLFQKEVFSGFDTSVKLLIEGQGHLWFLYMLFLLYVLSFPIYLMLRRGSKWSCVLVSLGICFVSCFFPLETSIFTIFFYQVFFLLGALIGDKHKQYENEVKMTNIVGHILIRCVAYILLFYMFSIVKESSCVSYVADACPRLHYFQHWFFRLLVGLLSILFTFSMFPVSVKPNKTLVGFASMSYKIYIVHQFVLVGLLTYAQPQLSALHKIMPWLFPFVLCFLVLSSSLFISLLFSKIPYLKSL